MRNFTKTHSSFKNFKEHENQSNLKEKLLNPLSFVISLISKICNWEIPNLSKQSRGISFKSAVLSLLILLSIGSNIFAQNAPIGNDKYYMLLGELIWHPATSTNSAETRVYNFNSGSSATTCSLPGGGEGMVIDSDSSIAYIATCCSVGEIRVYDMKKGQFLTPISIPGEDFLDVSITSNFDYVYAATYNRVYKISTATKTVVASALKSSLVNNTASNFWGVAVNSAGRVFVSSNWQDGNGTSTIESFASSLTGASTLFATAPAGYHFRGIVFDASGDLWTVASYQNNTAPDKLYKFTPSGTRTEYTFNTATASGVGRVDPYDLAFDEDGALYITTFQGDCVTKFSGGVFSPYIPFQENVGGKSISFVGGNFSCICNNPVLNKSNLSQKTATCTNGVSNNNATVTIGGLVYSSSEIVKGDIKEGITYGELPLYGAGTNKTLASGQTSLTFSNLKPGTNYTIRVWSGKDECFTDLTFKTGDAVCFTCACTSNNFSTNGDFASTNNPPLSWTAPQGQWSLGTLSSTGNFGLLNNNDLAGDYYVYQDITLTAGEKVTLNALVSTHGVTTAGAVAEMYMEFYNGTSLITTSAKSATYLAYNGTLEDLNDIIFTAPTGTTKVRIVGHSRGRALKFDNVTLTKCYSALTLVQGTTTQPICTQTNGSVTLTAGGGSGSYQYRVNGGAYQPSNVFSNLAAGTYTFEIKDNNSACTKTLSVTLTCVYDCNYSFTNADPVTAQVNPGQIFNLSVDTDLPTGTSVQWARSTLNVTDINNLNTGNSTILSTTTVSNGGVSLDVTAPTTNGTYYYYLYKTTKDGCLKFQKFTITVTPIGTNDPVCFSGSRVLTDNLLNGACGGTSTNYALWLDMTSSAGSTNYKYFKTSSLQFEEYCDGTAKIFGKVCAIGGGASDCFDVVYNLSGRTATTPTYSPKPNSCSTYGNDLYYYTSGIGTITGVSGGIYQGFIATIDDASNNAMAAFQVGTGANVNTNGFGASGWYNVLISNGGTKGWSNNSNHGDFNFNLGSQIPFALTASKSASTVCVDGDVTLNAMIKGNVPTSCGLSYSWKSPSGANVSNSQSYTIPGIQENQAGVYTVTATYTSGGKTCSATATVNVVVDPNCGGTPICAPACTNSNIVTWNLNACNSGYGANWYGEFTPVVSNGGCGSITASNVYRMNPDVNYHSCADNLVDGSSAMCVDGVNSTSIPLSTDSKAVRFSVTIDPSAGKSYNLSGLTFDVKRSGFNCLTGGAQSLQLYILKDGVQVHSETITGLTTTWTAKSFGQSGNFDFISDKKAVYDFIIVGF